MKAKRVQSQLHVRVHESNSEPLSQEEIRRRLKELFLLLYEIDQQNNVSKEYQNGNKD